MTAIRVDTITAFSFSLDRRLRRMDDLNRQQLSITLDVLCEGSKRKPALQIIEDWLATYRVIPAARYQSQAVITVVIGALLNLAQSSIGSL